MKAPSPPPTPDPYKTAAAQQMANVEVAVANTVLSNADKIGPHGSTTYEELPQLFPTHTYDANGAVTGTRNIKRWRETTSLTPKSQLVFNQQQDISYAMNTAALTQAQLLTSRWQAPFQLSHLPARAATPALDALDTAIPTLRPFVREIGQNDDIIREKDNHRRDLLERLNWQTNADRDKRMVALSDMGIFPGMEAWERDMRPFDRQVTDNRLQVEVLVGQEHTRLVELTRVKAEFHNQTVTQEWQLMLTRLDAGNKLKLQMFDVAQAIATYVNAVREQSMQEFLTERSQTVNEISSLMHGGQVVVPKGEGFKSGKISDTPVGEYVYRSAAMDMQKWQMKVQSQQSMMGGIMGLAGNMMAMPGMFSDRRLKTDIVKVSDDARGFGWYVWRYLWDKVGTRRYGVMAQEVLPIVPEAVIEVGGVLRVNYGALT